MIIRAELEIGMCYIVSDYCGQVFNCVITLHGVGMIFLFIMPYLIGVVGNKELPLKLSIADFQLPRLNIFSLWLTVNAIILTVDAVNKEESLGTG